MKLLWILVASCLVAVSFSSGLVAGLPSDPRQNMQEEIAVFGISDAAPPPCLTVEELETLKSPIIPERLEVEIPDIRGWTTNLLSATLSSDFSIGDQFKKDFAAFVTASYTEELECRMPAKVRISGDFRDHLDAANYQTPMASLDVRLFEESLGGITRFKLFMPGSRIDQMEILQTEFLRSQGLIAPRTFRIPAMVNGVPVTYLLQEKVSKELVEYHSLRESVMLEADESLFWGGEKALTEESVFARAINLNWVESGTASNDIGWRGIQSLTRAIGTTWRPLEAMADGSIVPNLISASLLTLSDGKPLDDARTFDALMLSTAAWHGLRPHNRQFYFDAITGDLVPIYYDGEPGRYFELESATPEAVLRFVATETDSGITPAEASELAEALKTVLTTEFGQNLEHLGADFTEQELIEWVQAAKLNLSFLTREELTPIDPTWPKSPHSIFGKNSILLAFGENSGAIILCEPEGNCVDRALSQEEWQDLLDGSLTIEDIPVKYAGPSRSGYEVGTYPNLVQGSLREVGVIDGMQILATGDVDISYGSGDVISISAREADTRVLMRGGHLENRTINAKWPSVSSAVLDQRFDQNLLTACLTLLDSQASSSSIRISGGGCEDSLNLIRVTGNLDHVEIRDAFQDGLDVDFSDVEIGSATIQRAGNDCLDFSGGAYRVGTAELFQCTDKGISVGEKAVVHVNDLSIGMADLGVAVKDSSAMSIDALRVADVRLCAAVYRKKQEFGGGSLRIDLSSCSEEQFLVQSGSRLEFADATAD